MYSRLLDPRGIVSRTLYDALSRTTASIANYTGGTAGSQTDVTTLFTFDSAGRLASRTAVQPTGTPSQVTGYVYGVSPATGSAITSNDIMAETRYPDPTTGLPSAAERDVYTANSLGERTSFTDRAGTTHSYLYDVTGRQTTDAVTALGAGVDGAIRRIESAYDTLGIVTSVTSFNAVTGGTAMNQVARAYNGFSQLASEWQSHTGLVNPATSPRVQYGYSLGTSGNHSRLTGVTYPDGYAVSYTYSGIDDAVSRLTSLTGLPATGSTTPVTLEAFKYLGAGTLIERSRPEVDVALSMVSQSGSTGDAGDQYTGLDRFGRVVDQRWLTGSGSTATDVDRYGYTYDRNSNRLTRSNALASAFSETYSYDALNQLQGFIRGSTSSPSTTQDWEFDALGNWTTVSTDGVDQTRTANAQNELTQVGSASLAYSTTGNLTTDAQGRILVYDAWNRLVSVNNASAAQVARYEYDGMNRRIVEQAGTLTTPAAVSAAVRDLFYSLNWQVLEERVRDAAGAIPAVADTRYVWSPVYVDALIARDRNTDGNITTGTGGLEERVYALQDANWNTTGIVAATGISGLTLGNVFTRFVYTPYGESQTLTASWGTPAAGSAPITPWSHLFQGLKLTDVTGLAYVRHRDYSPTMGRFIERDPIGFEAGDGNWYRFVGGHPTFSSDPSGLWKIQRDPQHNWARAIKEGSNETEQSLSQLLRLNHEEFGKWAKTDGDCGYLVPNTVVVYTSKAHGWDNWAPPPIVNTMRKMAEQGGKNYASKGYKVLFHTNESSDKLFKDLWKTDGLFAFAFGGHGLGYQGNLYGYQAEAGSEIGVAPSDVSPPYHLQAIGAYSCSSALAVTSGNSNISSVSKWRDFVSAEGTYVGFTADVTWVNVWWNQESVNAGIIPP